MNILNIEKNANVRIEKIKTKKFNYIHEFDRYSFSDFVDDKLKKI